MIFVGTGETPGFRFDGDGDRSEGALFIDAYILRDWKPILNAVDGREPDGRNSNQ